MTILDDAPGGMANTIKRFDTLPRANNYAKAGFNVHHACHPFEVPASHFLERLVQNLNERVHTYAKTTSAEDALIQCFLYNQIQGWSKAHGRQAIHLLYRYFLDQHNDIESTLRHVPSSYINLFKNLLAQVKSDDWRSWGDETYKDMISWGGLSEAIIVFMLNNPLDERDV